MPWFICRMHPRPIYIEDVQKFKHLAPVPLIVVRSSKPRERFSALKYVIASVDIALWVSILQLKSTRSSSLHILIIAVGWMIIGPSLKVGVLKFCWILCDPYLDGFLGRLRGQRFLWAVRGPFLLWFGRVPRLFPFASGTLPLEAFGWQI